MLVNFEKDMLEISSFLASDSRNTHLLLFSKIMNKNNNVLQNLRESYQIFISDKLKISDGNCGRGVFTSAVLEQSELLIRCR